MHEKQADSFGGLPFSYADDAAGKNPPAFFISPVDKYMLRAYNNK
jgi:hypothetical protein